MSNRFCNSGMRDQKAHILWSKANGKAQAQLTCIPGNGLPTVPALRSPFSGFDNAMTN